MVPESQYRASLCMERRIHGEDADHPSIAISLHQLGSVLKQKGDFDGAVSQYGASLRMMRRIHGNDAVHPVIDSAEQNLIMILLLLLQGDGEGVEA